MIALAARRLDEIRQGQLIELAPDIERRLAHRFHIDAFIGIEIEDDQVGRLQFVDGAAPDVDLDHAILDEGRNPVEIPDEQDLLAVRRVLHPGDLLMHAGRGVFLEEARTANAVRRAHQAERPVDDKLFHDHRGRSGR